MSNNNEGGTLGLVTCVTMIIGGIIGSAIFSLTGLTIVDAGPSSILGWGIAAIIMLCYGLIVAELATIYPESGGVFIFPAKALGKKEGTGKLWGWISVWGYINSNIVAISFTAIYVGIYLGVGYPIFSNYQVPLAVVSVLIIFLLNTIKFSVAGKANAILVTCLVVTLLIYIGVGLFTGAWDSSMLTPFFTQGASGSLGFLTIVPTAMVGYGAIVSIAFMVSEVKDPNRNVPQSVMISMGIVFLLYVLVILTTVGLVSASYLTANPEMTYIPLYAAAITKLMSIAWLSKVISVSAVLALFTTMLVLMALTARAIAATSDGGMLPEVLGKQGKTGTPIYATIIVTVVSLIIACFPQFTEQIVSLAALFASVTIIITCISLIAARKKNVYVDGAFKVPGGNALPIVVMVIIVICYIPDILHGGIVLWIYTLAWYALGLVIYYFRRKS